MEKNILEKYLNKEVIIEEKLYNSSSTVYTESNYAKRMSMGMTNITEGILTSIEDDYIELDNKMLIARKFIYRIILK